MISFTKKTAMPHNKFLDLVNLILKTVWYTFSFQFYQKSDGFAIGYFTTAEIYMQAHWYAAISTAGLEMIYWWGLFNSLTYAFGKPFPSYQQSSSKRQLYHEGRK